MFPLLADKEDIHCPALEHPSAWECHDRGEVMPWCVPPVQLWVEDVSITPHGSEGQTHPEGSWLSLGNHLPVMCVVAELQSQPQC